MQLEGLTATEATLEIDGNGSIRVSVQDELRYEIDGSGDISYVGQPSVHGRIDGAGSVRPHKARRSEAR